ncbi:hypothetical protein AKJ57_00045 [candidate division MSBL1 archaeon SCGC-AAA259A05]|uniref:Uncharacterized protein n=1 Tax=candidate division MSBL1 archaeon SCGC-AAA259A05 TaxID=1698259 RepID=A0A133UC13_9EURY|nr:hypothetical protein AKJ57_00045 [candidate division MSBL1 archaeon SCGC-AAA259A05]
MSKTTIQIDKKTRDMLRAAGSKGDTYDDIVRELVELRNAFIRDLYRIMEETSEKEWTPLDDFDWGLE